MVLRSLFLEFPTASGDSMYCPGDSACDKSNAPSKHDVSWAIQLAILNLR